MKIRIWQIAVFVVALLVAAVVFAPVSLFVPSRNGGFSYGATSGSIWQAKFTDARLSGLRVGDVEWKLSLFDLVQGRIQVDLRMSGGDVIGDVRMLGNFKGDRRVIADNLVIEGATLADDFRLMGGSRVQKLDLYFSEGKCVTATGVLTSEVLMRNPERLNWRGPRLGGEASCQDDGAAQLALSGAQDNDVIQTRFELQQSGEGEWTVYADVKQPELRSLLTARGFKPRAQGSTNLTTSRSFTWLPQ